MDYSKYLNKNQLEAVTTDMTHVRVVAGAGSGKTRVLTYRIAYLLSDMGVRASHILAITFTNKAAKEMKERVKKLVPEHSHDLQIKTFHSFAAFFLRLEIDAIGFSTKFTIMDEEDQENLVKNIASEMGYKKKDPIVKKALNYIASNKLHERYPDDIVIKHEMFEGESECLKIYESYEEAKDRMFTLDFDDLLLKANYILSEYPAIREKWQRKYDHILVDEFQDTNDVEFKLIKLLMKPSTSLYVVTISSVR